MAPAPPTVNFSPAGTPTATVPAADGFDEELRRLLRSRLILVHLLALAYVVLLEVMISFTSADSQIRREKVSLLLAVPFLQSLTGAIVLWRSPALSVPSLRLWELVHFVTQAAFYGLLRYTTLVVTPEGSAHIEVGFRGAVTLFFFMPLILAYGVLIPNTRRRSLLVVFGLTTVPFAALAAAAVANPVPLSGPLPTLVFQALANLLFPAAIAVFAAARADALQRRAFAAERRAEQVGAYTLRSKLGGGGMGEVWLAEHRLLKRACAVKFIRGDLAAHPATVARFAREVQAVTALTHPNTVRVYDYGRADDGVFFYVMEYLDGPTLDRLVRDHGPLPPGRAVHLARQLCGALTEAHAAGLVHRDVKPGNVIVAAQGGQHDVAKLLDFGLVQDSAAEADGKLTQAGVVLGTPAYMCPEQAAGRGGVDARGDVYSLGAVLYFMLAGRPPFERKTVGEFVAAHLSEPAPRLAEAPADVADVVARCLAKDPAGRFPSAAELDRVLAGCGCAGDWSADRAADWWTGVRAAGASATGSEPTGSYN